MKKPKTKKKTPEQVVNDIQEACQLLGWHIAMDESKTGVMGLIIGVAPYVESIMENLPDSESYSIYASAEASDEVH